VNFAFPIRSYDLKRGFVRSHGCQITNQIHNFGGILDHELRLEIAFVGAALANANGISRVPDSSWFEP
jgi:hypothetical protein